MILGNFSLSYGVLVRLVNEPQPDQSRKYLLQRQSKRVVGAGLQTSNVQSFHTNKELTHEVELLELLPVRARENNSIYIIYTRKQRSSSICDFHLRSSSSVPMKLHN